MANVLEMAIVQAILQLHAAKWSQRRIARELKIDRGAVARCLKSFPSDPKPAIPPTGSEGSKPATFESAPAPAVEGSDRSENSGRSGVPKPAIPPTGKPGSPDAASPACNRPCANAITAGRHSDCEPLLSVAA